MEPVIAPLMTEVSFTLRDLICMMGESVVDTAAVDIQLFSAVLHADAGAFNMPSGIAHTPGGIPFQGLVFEFGLCEPQNEVRLVALVVIGFHIIPDADGQVFFLKVLENIILFQLACIKIDIFTGTVSIAVLKKLFNNADKFINASGGGLHYVRRFDVQLRAVIEKRVCIELRDFHDGFILALRTLEHFVFACVSVTGKMSDVGNVHDTQHIQTGIAQVFFENILHDVGAEVADMRIVVNGRSAGIELNFSGLVRNELFLQMRKGIVQKHWHDLLSLSAGMKKASCCPVTARGDTIAVPLSFITQTADNGAIRGHYSHAPGRTS